MSNRQSKKCRLRLSRLHKKPILDRRSRSHRKGVGFGGKAAECRNCHNPRVCESWPAGHTGTKFKTSRRHWPHRSGHQGRMPRRSSVLCQELFCDHYKPFLHSDALRGKDHEGRTLRDNSEGSLGFALIKYSQNFLKLKVAH